MSGSLLKKFDELMHCTNVLAEGIEGDFKTFVCIQEEYRKKWHESAELQNNLKKCISRYQVQDDTLDVKLRMVEHQLNAEVKRRQQAEQVFGHMSQQVRVMKGVVIEKVQHSEHDNNRKKSIDIESIDKDQTDNYPIKPVSPQKIDTKRKIHTYTTISNIQPVCTFNTFHEDKHKTVGTLKPSEEPLTHKFVVKYAKMMERCVPCNKRVWFGGKISKCMTCKSVCHSDCKINMPSLCQPIKKKEDKSVGTLGYYVYHNNELKVPDLVTQCIAEVELRGLQTIGLYRIPGSESDIKELKMKFLNKQNPDLRQVQNIHVICGCLKNFLRNLREPLVTFSLHETFIAAADLNNTDDNLSAMYQILAELPEPNKHTLATVILHLQNVAKSTKTQMDVLNLSKVFGPTLVGHGSGNPTPPQMKDDMKHQPLVVSCLLDMSPDFWNGVLETSFLI